MFQKICEIICKVSQPDNRRFSLIFMELTMKTCPAIHSFCEFLMYLNMKLSKTSQTHCDENLPTIEFCEVRKMSI